MAYTVDKTNSSASPSSYTVQDGVLNTQTDLNFVGKVGVHFYDGKYKETGDGVATTNKTIDANGTGNSITNLEVADLASGVLDTDLSSVSGSDDTIPSAKATKTYVDTQLTAEDLDISADSGSNIAIDLDSDVLDLEGGTGIDTTTGSNKVTFAVDSTIATLTGSQTLTNKGINLANNTVTSTLAQLNTAVSDATLVDLDDAQTLTNKVLNLESNTAIVEFAVTVANPGSGNRYYLDGELSANVQLIPGVTYRLDQSDNSNSGHPLRLSTTKNGTHASGSAYTTGVTTPGSAGSAGSFGSGGSGGSG